MNDVKRWWHSNLFWLLSRYPSKEKIYLDQWIGFYVNWWWMCSFTDSFINIDKSYTYNSSAQLYEQMPSKTVLCSIILAEHEPLQRLVVKGGDDLCVIIYIMKHIYVAPEQSNPVLRPVQYYYPWFRPVSIKMTSQLPGEYTTHAAIKGAKRYSNT